MKIGVTGPNGVIGKLVIQGFLKKEVEVVPYTSDIRDYDTLREWLILHNITHLIHLAAKVAVHEVENNLNEAIDVNIGGVLNIVKALHSYGRVKFLFFASSSHVYAAKEGKIREEDELAPLSLYGNTKKIGEDIFQLIMV